MRRDAYRESWRHAMKKQEVDFILTVSHALPPMPHGGTGIATLLSANYAFLFNIVRVQFFLGSLKLWSLVSGY